MKVTVDFEECLKDSPRFRAALEEVEGDVTELELKLDKERDPGRAHSWGLEAKLEKSGTGQLNSLLPRAEARGCAIPS